MRTGRPHWLLIDEAHHLLPKAWGHPTERFDESILVTVHPERLAPSILAWVDVVIAVRASPDKTLREFAAASKRPLDRVHALRTEKNQVACWDIERRVDLEPAQTRALVRAAIEIRYTFPE